ncbi:glycosyltransferase, partial [Streptomyces sp. NPDC059552]
ATMTASAVAARRGAGGDHLFDVPPGGAPAPAGGVGARAGAPPDPALLLGVPMSLPTTGAAQRGRLTASGRAVRDLPELCDVDTPADAERVAAAVPGTRFAALHCGLRGATR